MEPKTVLHEKTNAEAVKLGEIVDNAVMGSLI